MRQMEIGPGATYTWANMQKGSGEQKVHMVEFNPTQGNLELQPGLTDGKVYGMQESAKWRPMPTRQAIASSRR